MPDPFRVGNPKPVLLRDHYADLIRGGALRPGERLTVSRVCEETGVERRTANRALHLLEDAGLVEIRLGRAGTMVLGKESRGTSERPG